MNPIQQRHDKLETMKLTQSVTLMSELRSQAHKDRGVLLERVKELENDVMLLRELNEGFRRNNEKLRTGT